MSKKTRQDLEREYAHAKAQLSRPGLDSSWVQMFTKKVKELERQLNLAVAGSKSPPPQSPPQPRPAPDSSQVNAAMRRVVAGLAAAARSGSNGLPSDLLEALEQEKSLNKAGIPASAFGGSGGQDAGAFPVGHFEFVRATTVSSCKGHEAPVVFFTGADQLDDAAWLLQGSNENGDQTPRGLERRRRAFFYVGATRAMYRQYISGLASSRFVQAAAYYAERLRGGTGVERASSGS